MFDALINGVVRTVLRLTGIGRVWDQFDSDPWLGAVFLVTILLSLLWMFRGKIPVLGIREEGSIAATFGKFPGGIAIAFLVVSVGIGLAMGLARMLVGMGVDSIISGIGQIWFIGPLIAKGLRWLADAVMGIVFAILLGIFILKSLQSIFQTVWGAFTGQAQGWADPKAPHGVKMHYQICGSVLIAILICNPEWNLKLWYAPGIASSIFGVYAFLTSTGAGKAITEHAGARFAGKKFADGSDLCTFVGWFPLYDVKAWEKKREKIPLIDPVTKKQRWEKRRCGYHNAALNQSCGSETCDEPCERPWNCPNPECPHHRGPKHPWETLKCPNCGAHRPELKHQKYGHFPWDDVFQAPQPAAAQPAVVQPPAVPQPAYPGWQVCLAVVPQRTPEGKKIPLRDAQGNPVMDPHTGQPRPRMGPCNTQNPPGAQRCSSCGSLLAGTRPQDGVIPPLQPMVFPEPVLEVPCLSCGRPYDASRGYKGCPHCGALLPVSQITVGAAPAVSPVVAFVPATPAAPTAPATPAPVPEPGAAIEIDEDALDVYGITFN